MALLKRGWAQRQPIMSLSDEEIKQRRLFRYNTEIIKIFRAKGRCEICGRFFGIDSSFVDGHHKLPKSKLPKNIKYNSEQNIIVCCKTCYTEKCKKDERGYR
jgi:hypothetical protein